MTPTPHTKKHWGLQVVGVFKLFKAALLYGLAFGLWSLVGRDLQTILTRLAHVLNADPHNRVFHIITEHVLKISPHLPLISIATFTYGTLFIVEGVGLLRRKRWAEWLTVIATASFLPVEIYELVHHSTWLKAAVLVLNIIIVAYLGVRLKKDKPPATAIRH